MLVCPSCGATYLRRQDHCGLDGHRLEERDVSPLVGQTLDKYRVIETIGSGGMATVYRGTHVHLEQSYALKVLNGEMASDSTLSRRFLREAKVMSRLAHPNIVSVVDFGITEPGLLYMVLEFIRGPTLSTELRARGAMEPTRIARLVTQIASALDHAHGKGFIHRDLKPQNIMLIAGEHDDELVKILDFGLVGLVEPDASMSTQLTAQGMFFGTPAYMSPEQVSGGAVGPPSDLYSLGVIMYAMLTGKLPFGGDARELAHKHVTARPLKPVDVHPGLRDLTLRLLEKEPKDRPSSGKKVVEAIRQTGLLDPQVSAPGYSAGELDGDGFDSEPALVLGDPSEFTDFGPTTPSRKGGRPRWLWLLFALVGGLAAVGAWKTGLVPRPAPSAAPTVDAGTWPDATDPVPDARPPPKKRAAPTNEAEPDPEPDHEPGAEAGRSAPRPKQKRRPPTRATPRPAPKPAPAVIPQEPDASPEVEELEAAEGEPDPELERRLEESLRRLEESTGTSTGSD